MKKIFKLLFAGLAAFIGIFIWNSGKRKGKQAVRQVIVDDILENDKEFHEEIKNLPDDERVRKLDQRVDDQLAALADKLS